MIWQIVFFLAVQAASFLARTSTRSPFKRRMGTRSISTIRTSVQLADIGHCTELQNLSPNDSHWARLPHFYQLKPRVLLGPNLNMVAVRQDRNVLAFSLPPPLPAPLYSERVMQGLVGRVSLSKDAFKLDANADHSWIHIKNCNLRIVKPAEWIGDFQANDKLFLVPNHLRDHLKANLEEPGWLISQIADPRLYAVLLEL